MRRLVVVLFACSSSAPGPVQNANPPAPQPTPDCAKLAARLGPLGGPTAYGGPAKREQMLAKMCTDERWGSQAIECVLTADRDPMSCLREPYLTPPQNERWNAVFAGYR
jgi:hypothetical protein